MARMITRQEAARMLEVDVQTVSNWLSHGLLRGHKHDGRTMVDSHTVLRHFDSLKDIRQTEERLKQLKAELAQREQYFEKHIADITKADVSSSTGISPRLLSDLYDTIITIAGDGVLTNREVYILRNVNNGLAVSRVAEKLGISRERVRQLVHHSLCKIAGMRTFSDILKENKALHLQVKEFQAIVEGYKCQLEQYDADKNSSMCIDGILHPDYHGREGISKLVSLLMSSIEDTSLSVRSKNNLKYADIGTLGDLVRRQKGTLFHTRRFGKKSLTEISDYLEDLHLHFGMNVDAIFQLNAKNYRNV